MTYLSLNRPKDSIKDCRTIIDLFPEKSDGYNCLGNKQIELKYYQDAMMSFSKAIEIEPNSLSYRTRANLKIRIKIFMAQLMILMNQLDLLQIILTT